MVNQLGRPGRRALVAEDDAGMLSHVCEILELDGYETVATDCGTSALEMARSERPAIAILDVNLPGLSGYEVCDALRKLYGHGLPIIFISGERVESFDRVAGLLVGADDYIVKPFAPDELLARVRCLLRRAGSSNGQWSLTPREREVLQLLADGRTQREIAAQLTISPRTVGAHIEHIHGKLGVSSRAQAVAAAYREGLVSAP